MATTTKRFAQKLNLKGRHHIRRANEERERVFSRKFYLNLTKLNEITKLSLFLSIHNYSFFQLTRFLLLLLTDFV